MTVLIVTPPKKSYGKLLHIPPRTWEPLWYRQTELKNHGIELKFHFQGQIIGQFETTIISSRWFNEDTSTDNVISYLENLRKQTKQIIWFDDRDSAGNTQFFVLPVVDSYWKKQLYANLEDYNREYYLNRKFSDFYLKLTNNEPVKFIPDAPLANYQVHAHKVKLSWNLGLADYTRQHNLIKLINQQVLQRQPELIWGNATKLRPLDIQARFGGNNKSDAFAAQRKIYRTILDNSNLQATPGARINLDQYWQELYQSKLTLSPFGFGEVCYRDFEAIIAGSLLIKPDMSHLTTWPNIYVDNQTYIPVRWDGSDLVETLQNALINDDTRQGIVDAAQANLRKANVEFLDRFINLLNLKGQPN